MFVAGIFIGSLGLFAWIYNSNSVFGLQKVHPNRSDFKFINPLLAVDTFERKELLEDKALGSRLENFIAAQKRQQNIKEISLYFRDLEPGRWVGINENFQFSPGVLLKVPIMMAYLKRAEPGLENLQKTLVYRRQSSPKLREDDGLVEGESYTIEDILRTMINGEGDGVAAFLFDNIPISYLNDIYSDLGINYGEDKENEDFITTKQYSLFFRVLYNATYLNRAMSEKALEILNGTDTTYGLSAVLPKDIKVSHKYRLRLFKKNQYEGHDCSIVYFPNHPYVLCAAVIGDDRFMIQDTLKSLGQLVYQNMQKVYSLTK